MRRLLCLIAATIALWPSAAGAHEKYFVDGSAYESDWAFATRPLNLALMVAVVLATVAWRLFFKRLPSPELKPLGFFAKLAPWVPRLLGVHLGVSLLALAVRGAFLAPNLSVHDIPGGDLHALIQGALGAWFISGFRLRMASILLMGAGPLALLATGPVFLLESLPLLGIAAFLIVMPPSADRWGAVALDPERVRVAMQLLRLGVGLGLIAISFSEKFANPALAQAILDSNPELNVFALLGLNVSTELFISIAAATELLFGLLVLSGAGAQTLVIVAGIPFNLTMLLFGGVELIGHLPVYGAFLALMVYGSHPETSRRLASLKPPPKEEVQEFSTDRPVPV